MSTIKIFTFGCKVNQYDSQIFRELFSSRGYNISDSNSYDIAFINTCCVTLKAQNECRKTIERLLKKGKQVWVSGCWVEKEDFYCNLEGVVVFHRESLFKQAQENGIRTINTFYAHNRAFVKVVDGCENFCSYCIVPFVRGRIRSRPISDIISEIRILIEKSFCEIVLTGVDLGSYGKDIGVSLKDLIKEIAKISGLKRLRLSSIEVFHLSDGLLEFLSSYENFCPSFHIPLQSGSSSVLKMMGRPYIYQQYKNCINRIRSIWSIATITTDIMVGFPTETETDFYQTISAIEECKFLKVHLFPFSLHKQTFAARLRNKISEKEKKTRFLQANEIAGRVSAAVKKHFIGRDLFVFVEGKREGVWFGYSENYIPVLIDTDAVLIGNIVRVTPEGLKNIGNQVYLLARKFSISP